MNFIEIAATDSHLLCSRFHFANGGDYRGTLQFRIERQTIIQVRRRIGGVRRFLGTGKLSKQQGNSMFRIVRPNPHATFCDGVERGLFRLHPKGIMGISLGCIVINNPAEFDHVAAKLRGSSQMLIPGLDIKAYGIVTVK
jgi:hypothetical protein